MPTASDLPRPEKLKVARGMIKNLKERKEKGPPEEALDNFIPEFEQVEKNLDMHVSGGVVADAARHALLLWVEKADGDVDADLLHHENFIWVETKRRHSPHAAAAEATYRAAFPERSGPVDAYIPVENRYCRNAIAVLREPQHAAVMQAIKLPESWTPQWEADLDESDAAFAELEKVRATKKGHTGGGVDAEDDFVDATVRLRRYIGSRAKRSEKDKMAEGKALLSPLDDAIDKLRREAAARATRREQTAKEAERSGTEQGTASGTELADTNTK
jgi:hypothetical protein